MLRIPRNVHTHTFLAQGLSPAARVESGSIVCFDTFDGLEGLSEDAAFGRFEPTPEQINPATGPLYINGAQPGDTLMVEILDIRCDTEGYVGLWMPKIGVHSPERDYARVPIQQEKAWLEGIPFELSPMIGTIGVAHPEGLSCRCAGCWGGNLDTPGIQKGAKLLLPVFVEGALLAMGDFHALQGDGEMLGQGIETGGEADVRVTLLKRKKLTQPLLFPRQGVMQLLSSHESLETAAEQALYECGQLLINLGLEPKKAAVLLAAKGQLQISEVVNVQSTVRIELKLEDLLKMGADLSRLW